MDNTLVAAVVSAGASLAAVAYTVNEARTTRREQREEKNNPELARIEAATTRRVQASYEALLTRAEESAAQAALRAKAAERAAKSAEVRAKRCDEKFNALRRYLRNQQVAIPAYFDDRDYDDG